MAKILLTKALLQSVTCPGNQAKLAFFDAGCRGLVLEVRPTGTKIYALRYLDSRGKQRQFKIGNADDLSLDQARKQAAKLRNQIALGEDIEESKDLLKQSDNQMLQYIVPMLILTGARKREVLDARWEDFDFERLHWRIHTTKLGKPRFVPMSDGVVSLLGSIQRLDCQWVFANPKTLKPYVSIFCSWNTARTKAGLADVRIHDLRHSYASFLVNAGRSLYEVQRLLGHTQIKTTQRYAHLSHDTLLDATNSVNTALGGMFAPMVAMAKAGSSGLILGLR